MTAPPVSIVLPVYNGAQYLPEALDSVRAQTFGDWELLLIDDGSTDSSTDLLRSEASTYRGKVRYLHHPNHVNRGTLATRVLGARFAQSELVALLDQDDIWDDQYLEEHVALWNGTGDSDLGLSYGPSHYWYPDDVNKDFVQPVPEGTPKTFLPGELLGPFLSSGYRNTPCPSCTLIRREALLQAERFGSAARFSHVEDQYLWWSVALRWPVSVHSHPMVRYRQHAKSAICTLMTSPQEVIRAQLTFLELISDEIAAVRQDHPVLPPLRSRIDTLRQKS